MNFALIIPALNEEPVIAALLTRIPSSLFRLVIVADNGSTDGTRRIAEAQGAAVVCEPQRGYGAACLRAIAALPQDIDAVAFMQADLSESPDELENLLAPIQEGRADLVIGSRTMGLADRGSLRPHQRFGNWLATGLIRALYGVRQTDIGPFRAIRLDALRRLRMEDRNYGWTVEMQVRAIEENLRVLEIPVSYHPRLAGEDKVSGNWRASIRAGVTILFTVLRLRARRRDAST